MIASYRHGKKGKLLPISIFTKDLYDRYHSSRNPSSERSCRCHSAGKNTTKDVITALVAGVIVSFDVVDDHLAKVPVAASHGGGNGVGTAGRRQPLKAVALHGKRQRQRLSTPLKAVAPHGECQRQGVRSGWQAGEAPVVAAISARQVGLISSDSLATKATLDATDISSNAHAPTA